MKKSSADTYHDLIVNEISRLAEALGYKASPRIGGERGIDVTVSNKIGKKVFVEVETGRYPKTLLRRRIKSIAECEGLILVCPRIGIAKKHAKDLNFPESKLYLTLPTDYKQVVPVLLHKILEK
jgi:hypothetical protein